MIYFVYSIKVQSHEQIIKEEKMNEEKWIKITKVILDFMFYTGIIILITLPFTLKYVGNNYIKVFRENYWPMLFIFGLAGIFGILIIAQLKIMIRTVINKDCFVYENVKSLRIMGIISFLISILFIIKAFLFPTPATFIIILTFFIAGLFSLVLSYVFCEAVKYKKENDLTI